MDAPSLLTSLTSFTFRLPCAEAMEEQMTTRGELRPYLYNVDVVGLKVLQWCRERSGTWLA